MMTVENSELRGQNNHNHKVENDFSYTERKDDLQTDEEQNTF